MRADIDSDLDALVVTWRALGARVSVAAGASVALLSLLSDAPVSVASTRGAIAWAAVTAVTKVGASLAKRTWVASQQEPEESAAESN